MEPSHRDSGGEVTKKAGYYVTKQKSLSEKVESGRGLYVSNFAAGLALQWPHRVFLNDFESKDRHSLKFDRASSFLSPHVL